MISDKLTTRLHESHRVVHPIECHVFNKKSKIEFSFSITKSRIKFILFHICCQVKLSVTFLQTETCAEMSLHVPRVLAYFRQVILRKDMDNDSALLLNAGAHYVKVTHSKAIFFSSYNHKDYHYWFIIHGMLLVLMT